MKFVAIRLKLKLKKNSKYSIEVIALVNSGYETIEPEILISRSLAEELKLLPKLPAGSEVKEYVLADGSTTRLVRIPKAVEVYVMEEDRIVGGIEANVVISEKTQESLISDKLAGKLGIIALDFAEGLWCFKDELGKKIRKTR